MKVRFFTDEKTGKAYVIERVYAQDDSFDEREIDAQALVGRRLQWTWMCGDDRMFEFVPC